MEKTVLGKYQLQSILGEGGMGVVYRAYDPHLARVVAIKTIRSSLLQGQSGHDLRDRFRREARAEGRLIHQNIIPIYEYHEDAGGTPFFVMEFVNGKDLKHCLSRGTPFSLDESLDIIEQVLQALAFSHKNGIVHRDIKPANILLMDDGSVKIADFGIAKMEESEYTRSGMILGTPQYSSPEQMVGGMVDARADLYSTGAVLYELITGKKAFSVDSSRKGKRKIRSDISFHSNQPKADRILSQVVAKALSKEADDRFLSAEAFLQALQMARPGKGDSHANVFLGLSVGIGSGIALLAALYYSLAPNPLPDIRFNKPMVPELIVLSEEQQAQLDKYLQVANIHMRVGRLVYPSGSNAIESYQMALKLNPKNQIALDGMADISNRLFTRIQQLLDEGNREEARIELDVALQHFPDEPRFKDYYRQLKPE